MDSNNSQESKGVSNKWVNCPAYQRSPSGESRERTPGIIVADSSHDTRISNTCARMSTKLRLPTMRRNVIMSLFVVGFQVVDIENTQFQCPDHQSGGIDTLTTVAIREEFLYQFVLAFLQTLHAKRHTP